MQKLTLFFATILCYTVVTSQNVPNPYSSIGKPTPKMVTLSNGAYDEFLLKEPIVLINGDAIKRETGELVYSQEENPKEIEKLKKQQEEKFRFLSVDPVFKSFPFLTPYQYASNSPIVNIDFDGMEGFNAAGGGYVTSPASNCNGCVPITQAEYQHYQRLYEADKLKGKGNDWKKLPYILIYKPSGFTDYGSGTYYSAPNKPKLQVSLATQFKGGSYTEILNEETLDKQINDFVDQLKSYEEIPTIEITTFTGKSGSKSKTGSTEEVYKQGSNIYNPDGTVNKKGTIGELMEKRGETMKKKLIDKGIPEDKIILKKGTHENDDKNRKATIEAKLES
ncbi:MAG: hypothetical protein SFY56_03070 [Bacteroidota bacterium]|nr:hypothetical protein [Bacteroidota bacterium]